MNKLFKGAVAGAAGVALLLGGAGTFALWNDTLPAITGQQIEAGQLRFDEGAATGGTWTVIRGNQETSLTTLAGFLVVPGDVLTYEVNGVGVIATGNHLTATLSYAGGAAVAANSDSAEDVALAEAMNEATHSFTVSGTINGDQIEGSTITVSPGDEVDLTVRIVLTFPEAAGNATQGGSVTLSDVNLTLQQGAVATS